MSRNLSNLPKSILFVCLGNICRSPIAEGMFRHIAKQRGFADHFVIDSAGLGSWHIGNPPDDRAQAAMRHRGIDIGDRLARQITPCDFEKFELILAMDRANRNALLKLAPKEHQHKIKLFMDFAPNLSVHEIPDPFFGDVEGFDYICQLVDAACRGLLVTLTAAQPSCQATPA
jgi:low molecular weight protein-tyrosine phosphatase